MTQSPIATMAATLAEAAAFLVSHPDIPAPFVTVYDHLPHVAGVKWYLHINDHGGAPEQRQTALGIIRAVGGAWDKAYRNDDVAFAQKRGSLNLLITVTRDAVCRRVVKGVETITVPAQPAVPEHTVEREIVEWECESVLAEAGVR